MVLLKASEKLQYSSGLKQNFNIFLRNILSPQFTIFHSFFFYAAEVPQIEPFLLEMQHVVDG